MKAIILAAGIGSRFKSVDLPKSLTPLPNGETILGRQIRILKSHDITDITIIVGFKRELIEQVAQKENISTLFNPDFDSTNTSKSLLLGLHTTEQDALWLNGDVIFDEQVVKRVKEARGNIIAVNTAKCSDEEIKYTLNAEGFVQEISKTVQNGLGEAVGVNKISTQDLKTYRQCLENCKSNDYFERGMELAIEQGTQFTTVDISDIRCMEIDFKDDFDAALQLFFNKSI